MSLIARLIEAGTPPDLIEEVAMLIAEQKALEKRRANDRQRQQDRRDRAAGHVTSRDVTDVTDCHDEAPLSPAPLPSPQTPKPTPHPHTPVKQTPRARGAAIPVDWVPKQFGVGTAAREIVDGWPPGRLESEAEHFVSHHRAKGTVSKDWHDSWSTWVHNSRRFRGAENGQRQNRNQSGSSSLDAMRRAIELTGGAEGGGPAEPGAGDWRTDPLPDPLRAIGHVQR